VGDVEILVVVVVVHHSVHREDVRMVQVRLNLSVPVEEEVAGDQLGPALVP
jgi:hypothetical protein